MGDRGSRRVLTGLLVSLAVWLSTGCVPAVTSVESEAPAEPLAASPSGDMKTQIDDDGIIVQVDVPAPMRDGVRLFADVYLPATDAPFPVILTRLPYDKQSSYGLMPALVSGRPRSPDTRRVFRRPRSTSPCWSATTRSG